MLSLALLAASSLFLGANAQSRPTIVGTVYIEADCRGAEVGYVDTPEQCTSAINGASIEVTSISQYCELRGFTDSGCSQNPVTIIALQGYTGCFSYAQDDVSYLEVVCTMTEVQDRDLPAVEASANELVVREPGTVGAHQKRWIISLGLAIFKVTNYAFAALGIYSSCTGAGGSSISLSACIWGIISTLVTAGMDINNLYGKSSADLSIGGEGIELGLILRSLPSDEDAKLEAYSRNVTEGMNANSVMTYTHHGYLYANDTKHGHLVPAGVSKWPVMEVTNPHGSKYHHVMVPHGEGYRHRLGPVNRVSARQAAYNGEYFTAGSMDSYACLNSGDYHDQLDQGDFNQVYDLISCGVPDTENTSDVEYQILDDTIRGTLGAGSIAGVNPNGQTHLTDDSKCPTGLAETSCGSESVSRLRRRN